MMVEAQIREALRELITPVPGVRGQIAFDVAEIPAEFQGHYVMVSCGDELIEQLTLGNPTTGAKQAHTLDLFVDIFYFNDAGALLMAEKILEPIIPRLFTDRTLGGLVKTFTAVGKRRDKNEDGGSVARLRLQCQTVFHTFDRDPTRSV